MKKPSRRQVDKLFVLSSHDLYDKFIENVTDLYMDLFPENCTLKDFVDSYYDMVRERLMFEFGVLYTEARGEKNAKNKFKKIAATTIRTKWVAD
jgi:hypothetical protein